LLSLLDLALTEGELSNCYATELADAVIMLLVYRPRWPQLLKCSKWEKVF